MRLSAKEISLISHAVGFNAKIPFYRNYFCATPGSEDDKIFDELCQKGIAALLYSPTEMYPYNTYDVTEKGIQFLKDMR